MKVFITRRRYSVSSAKGLSVNIAGGTSIVSFAGFPFDGGRGSSETTTEGRFNVRGRKNVGGQISAKTWHGSCLFDCPLV